MAVMSKKQSNTSMTAKQEELAYCQFIEDFLNYSFVKNQSDSFYQGINESGDAEAARYDQLILLLSIPQLMHGSFISQPMQLKVLQKIQDMLDRVQSEISNEEPAAEGEEASGHKAG